METKYVIEGALRNIELPAIDFQDEAFVTCISDLERLINEHNPFPGEISLVLDPEAVSSGLGKFPVTMSLTEVPAYEAIRYLSTLSSTWITLEQGGKVIFVSRSHGFEPVLEEAWFEPSEGYFFDFDLSQETVNVVESFTRAGVDFPNGSSAEFYPDRNLLKVVNTVDQIELVDAYLASVFRCHEFTWRDRIYGWWLAQKEKWNPSPLGPPAPAAPLPPAPDPFKSSEPDPFR